MMPSQKPHHHRSSYRPTFNLLSLACADKPTAPHLTEEEIRAIVLDTVASHTLTAEELTANRF